MTFLKQNRHLKLFLIFCFVFLNTTKANSFELRVLSYNIQGLPIPFFYDHTRYLDIGKKILERKKLGNEPHIIAIQEGFHHRVSELIDIVKYPHVFYGPKAKGGKVSSGLIYLSKFPILENRKMAFKNCTGFDCMSRKGAHLIKIQIPGTNLQIKIVNTHMNANDSEYYDPDAAQCRLEQLQEIRDFYWTYDFDHKSADIILGDFNFAYNEYEFTSFEYFMDMKNSAMWCLEAGTCRGEDPREDLQIAIDHQFFKNGTDVKLTPVFFERNFREVVNGRYLSDHLGHEVHYKVESK